jgi:hypothetical protein
MLSLSDGISGGRIMRLRTFVVAALAAVVWTGSALAAASSPEAVIITEGDITDKPYKIIGDISLTVKKVGIVDRPPIDVKAENALRAKAVEMGADAVILVRYDKQGFTGLSMGRIDATGRAVVFGSGPGFATGAATAPNTTSSTGLSTSSRTANSAGTASAPSLADAYGTGKVRGYLDALTAGDAAAALALLDDSVTIEDPVGTGQTGKAAAEAYLRGLVARGVKYELVLPVRGGGTQAAAAVRIRSSAGLQSAILVFALSPNGSVASIKVYGGAE